jgi:hypothetical protein
MPAGGGQRRFVFVMKIYVLALGKQLVSSIAKATSDYLRTLILLSGTENLVD